MWHAYSTSSAACRSQVSHQGISLSIVRAGGGGDFIFHFSGEPGNEAIVLANCKWWITSLTIYFNSGHGQII